MNSKCDCCHGCCAKPKKKIVKKSLSFIKKSKLKKPVKKITKKKK